MKILIIGSEGFIGNITKTHFKSIGYNVSCCDIIINKFDKDFFLISPIAPDFEAIFKSNKFDICINASGAANVNFSLQNPEIDYELNVTNVFRILDSIRKYNPSCKFINLSSAAVYGNPSLLPISEEHPVKPISPYGWHKYQSEQICKEFYDQFNIKTCSLRIFSAYGPGLQKQIIWDIYQKSINNKRVQLFGTGEESRDFIYIKDLVVVFEKLAQSNYFHGDVLNVANGKQIFIKDLVMMIKKSFNLNCDFSFSGEIRKGDPLNWEANISRLKNLGYSQYYEMEKGLDDLYLWIKELK